MNPPGLEANNADHTAHAVRVARERCLPSLVMQLKQEKGSESAPLLYFIVF
jgi:hypothetical protein